MKSVLRNLRARNAREGLIAFAFREDWPDGWDLTVIWAERIREWILEEIDANPETFTESERAMIARLRKKAGGK